MSSNAALQNARLAPMGLLVIYAVLIGLLTDSLLPGLFGAPATAAQNKRWLLVVETSSTMQRRKQATLQTIDSLLASRMGGQLENGDTIGVWTFNTQLSVGKFPLKKWSADTASGVRSEILRFVGSQAFEKQPQPSQLGPAISQIISNSALITVVLVTSSEGAISGTPFDQQINQTWANSRPEQSRVLLPVITVVRGVSGGFSEFTVSPAQYSAEFPPLPEPGPVAESESPSTPQPERQVVPAKPAVAVTSLPPLIIIGKKPEPEPLATTNPPPAAVVTPQLPIPAVTNVPSTSAPALAEQPAHAGPAKTGQPAPETLQTTGEVAKAPQSPASKEAVQPSLDQGIPATHTTDASRTASDHSWIWVAAGGVAALFMLALIWFKFFRRKPAPASLITRSLEHDDSK